MRLVNQAHLYFSSTWRCSSNLQPREAPYLHSQALTLYCISWSRQLRGTVLYSVLSARIKGRPRHRAAPIHLHPSRQKHLSRTDVPAEHVEKNIYILPKPTRVGAPCRRDDSHFADRLINSCLIVVKYTFNFYICQFILLA